MIAFLQGRTAPEPLLEPATERVEENPTDVRVLQAPLPRLREDRSRNPSAPTSAIDSISISAIRVM